MVLRQWWSCQFDMWTERRTVETIDHLETIFKVFRRRATNLFNSNDDDGRTIAVLKGSSMDNSLGTVDRSVGCLGHSIISSHIGRDSWKTSFRNRESVGRNERRTSSWIACFIMVIIIVGHRRILGHTGQRERIDRNTSLTTSEQSKSSDNDRLNRTYEIRVR